MSRWTETFAALSRADDTLDTKRHSRELPSTVSQSVKSVTALVSKPAARSGAVTPVPDAWSDAHGERAAAIEYDGGAPRAWAEALARLDPAKPPADVPPRRWLRFINDCGRFLDGGWVERAVALGWGPLDLFGCDRERRFVRIDHLGLLWLLNAAL
jgi:hypothetical protein